MKSNSVTFSPNLDRCSHRGCKRSFGKIKAWVHLLDLKRVPGLQRQRLPWSKSFDVGEEQVRLRVHCVYMRRIGFATKAVEGLIRSRAGQTLV